jgi:hypothetical protein
MCCWRCHFQPPFVVGCNLTIGHFVGGFSSLDRQDNNLLSAGLRGYAPCDFTLLWIARSTVLDSKCGGFRTIGQVQLAQHIADVVSDGPLAQEKLYRDLAVRCPRSDQD